jgi:hypothetical protein
MWSSKKLDFGVFYELLRIYQVSADSKNKEKRKTTKDIDFATATLNFHNQFFLLPSLLPHKQSTGGLCMRWLACAVRIISDLIYPNFFSGLLDIQRILTVFA